MYRPLILALLMASCNSTGSKAALLDPESIPEQKTISRVTVEDTLAGMPVTIIMDSGMVYQSAVLVLPGWDYERHRWLKESGIGAEAAKRHACLILPEMSKSIYATHYYKETSAEALKEKTGTWLTDSFIPAVQKKYKALKPDGRNFVLGLSTGGRGAVYCAWKKPDIFKAAAALSGDFDQTLSPTDFLATSVYGSYEKNKERWTKEDNLVYVADSIRQPVYLAHGDVDKVVPFRQSMAFFNQIKKTNSKAKFHLASGAGHDFKFWDSQVVPVFNFFDDVK